MFSRRVWVWLLLPGALPKERTAMERRKLVLAILSLGLLVDLGISLVLYNNSVNTSKAQDKATVAAEVAYATCLQQNVFRSDDLARWKAVLKLVTEMPSNPATERFVAGVEAINAHADQPRTCPKP